MKKFKTDNVITLRTVSSLSKERQTDVTLLAHLKFPAHFMALGANQRADLLTLLYKVGKDDQQKVLNEWAARCQVDEIHNPAGYLFTLLGKARRQQFRPCMALKDIQEEKANSAASAPVSQGISPRAPSPGMHQGSEETWSPETAVAYARQIKSDFLRPKK